MRASVIVVAVALAAVLLLAQVSALTVPVDANREECFYEDVDPGAKVAVSFQVRVAPTGRGGAGNRTADAVGEGASWSLQMRG